jgi:hypothetical protein
VLVRRVLREWQYYVVSVLGLLINLDLLDLELHPQNTSSYLISLS